MSNELVLTRTVAEAGAVANAVAVNHIFMDFISRKSENTLKAHGADLAAFCEYMHGAGIDCPAADRLQTEPAAWAGVTWGLVAGFVKWSLAQGAAVATVNRRLSTVKAYAKLASKAGVIDGTEIVLIKDVSGYGHKERERVNEKRSVTRIGHKKAGNVELSAADAQALKDQPDTPQGRRDRVLMCLLLDHGLRCGEVAGLAVTDVDLANGELRFYRPKVQKSQRHKLTREAAAALQAYYSAGDVPAVGQLLRGSNKSGSLTTKGMSNRAINSRVGALGQAAGIDGLSPHDCRHYWATRAIAKGTDPFALQQAGGWNSLSTVRRYVDENEIANDGVIL